MDAGPQAPVTPGARDPRPIPGAGLLPKSDMCHLPLHFSVQPTAWGVRVEPKEGGETGNYLLDKVSD